MGLERLPEKKKWIFRRVPLGQKVTPSGSADIVTLNVTKQARVTGVNLEAPGLQLFDLIERNQDGTGVVALMPYRLQSGGMIVDARTFEEPIAWIAANKTIAIRTTPGASAVVSGLVRAGLTVWELEG